MKPTKFEINRDDGTSLYMIVSSLPRALYVWISTDSIPHSGSTLISAPNSFNGQVSESLIIGESISSSLGTILARRFTKIVTLNVKSDLEFTDVEVKAIVDRIAGISDAT
jgi:hypothetical protein